MKGTPVEVYGGRMNINYATIEPFNAGGTLPEQTYNKEG
jgi:hypothetical protein